MVTIPYLFGGATRSLRVPARNLVHPVNETPAPAERPDWDRVAEALRGSRRLLVVVNDAYRPTPTRHVLDRLAGALTGVPDVRIVVATGMHPAPSAAWLAATLGDRAGTDRVSVHDAHAAGHDFGTLADGTRLMLNPLLAWADRLLLIGSVEAHFFAGFTGGAKQLLPGLAARATIEANHRNAISADCAPLRLHDNPVAAGIRATAQHFADRIVSVQAVSGNDGWEFFCGSEPDTFDRASRRSAELARVRWEGKLDLLVAVVDPPLDRNIYQLQKGFENHRAAVREGGGMLLISACREGVGNDFFGPLAERYPDWRSLPEWASQPYSLGLHKLYRTAEARRRLDLHVHSMQPDALTRRFYFEPAHDPQRWLEERCTAAARVGIVKDAGARVSVVD